MFEVTGPGESGERNDDLLILFNLRKATITVSIAQQGLVLGLELLTVAIDDRCGLPSRPRSCVLHDKETVASKLFDLCFRCSHHTREVFESSCRDLTKKKS